MIGAVATTAEKVKRLRRERLMTQEQLAKEAGVAASTVVYIEMAGDKGTSEPRFSTLRKLARALGVDPRELLED